MINQYLSNQIKPSRDGFVTNYPPYRQWKKINPDDFMINKPLNIYIHIPFCTKKCAYCYYMTVENKSKDQQDKFVGLLCDEIKLVTQKYKLYKRLIKSIYFGGGTPTLLQSRHYSKIFNCLKENFDIKKPEITIEAEPLTINEKRIIYLKEFGINRISIGIQSFNDEILKLSNRKHTKSKAISAIDFLKKKSDVIINIDLLSGLAGETQKTWQKTIQEAINSNVHSITIYKMEAYSNTSFFQKGIRKKELLIPSSEEEEIFIDYALNELNKAYYLPWSTFTFTQNGDFIHTHSPSVWRGEEIYGFGPSAFGYVDSFLLQNTNDFKTYFTQLGNSRLPLYRGLKLGIKEKIIREILLGMKLLYISKNHFIDNYNINIWDYLHDEMNKLEKDKLIEFDDNKILLSRKGILFGDHVGKRLANTFKQSFT